MKKLYILSSLILCSVALKAQHTLTAAAITPSIGDVEKRWDLDTTNLSMGSAGTSQIWNYTNISITPSVPVNQENYVDESSAPNASLFPAANIAAENNGGYTMYAFTNSNVVLYGFSDPGQTVVFSNPLTFVTLPFSYGMISTDTYSGSFTFSGQPVSINGTLTTTADGLGTLNTPNNNFTNVLRIKTDMKQIVNFGVGTETTTTTGYAYYGSASKFPLLSVSKETVSSTFTTTSYYKSGDVNDMVLASLDEKQLAQNFSLYPNPATGKQVELHYVISGNENYTLYVYNALGQKVKEIGFGDQAPGMYRETIDLKELAPGAYFLNLKGNTLNGTQKLIIE